MIADVLIIKMYILNLSHCPLPFDLAGLAHSQIHRLNNAPTPHIKVRKPAFSVATSALGNEIPLKPLQILFTFKLKVLHSPTTIHEQDMLVYRWLFTSVEIQRNESFFCRFPYNCSPSEVLGLQRS